jgi:hypothetical protein
MNHELKTKLQTIKETEDLTFNIEIEKDGEINFYELGYYYLEYTDKSNNNYEYVMWIDVPESMFLNVTAEKILDSKTPEEIIKEFKLNKIIFDKDVSVSCDYGDSYGVLRIYLIKLDLAFDKSIMEQNFDFLYDRIHKVASQLSTNKKLEFSIQE